MIAPAFKREGKEMVIAKAIALVKVAGLGLIVLLSDDILSKNALSHRVHGWILA